MLLELSEQDPKGQRIYLYYWALGLYKQKQYLAARRKLTELLDLEPENLQARSLKLVLDDQIRMGTTLYL